jgi:L-lactate utilization protein LutB
VSKLRNGDWDGFSEQFSWAENDYNEAKGEDGLKEDLNIQNEENALYERLAKRAIENLNRRGINAQYAPGKKEALSMVMEMIPAGVTVGTADSMTLLQVGIISALKKRGQNDIFNPFERDAEGNRLFQGEQKEDLKRKSFFSDVFVVGTNAVTLDGKLVNTDAGGNRVAAMIFGPKKVIVVAGANKIVKDLEGALRRIREVAAPQNALRIGTKHHSAEHMELPCATSGICTDCNHPRRICRYTTIIEGVSSEHRGRINVVLVGERLGI